MRTIVALGMLITTALITAPAHSASTDVGPRFELDPAHTEVEFQARHMMISTVKGHFDKVSGSFNYNDKTKKISNVEVAIETASVNTRVQQRDDHLRSADFFDVKKPGFDKMTFKAKEFTATAGKDFKLQGELTIKGKTLPIKLKGKFVGSMVNPMTKMERVGFELHGEVSRKAYGLNWNQTLETGGVVVGDTIKIRIDSEAEVPKPSETAAPTEKK